MGKRHKVGMVRPACTLILGLGLALVPGAPVVAGAPVHARAAHPVHPWGPVDLPDSGALFGVHLNLDEHNGLERRQAILDFEQLVGRKMALERIYYAWDDPFPTADDYWSNQQGRLLYLSWNAGFRDEINCAQWADIAAGLHDDAIDAKAEAIKAFGDPLILSFHHEPPPAHPMGNSAALLSNTPPHGATFASGWTHVAWPT